MKIIITTICSLFLIGCAPRDIPPPFENSNQRFIDNTIKKLNIGQEIAEIIDTTSRIVIISLEEYQPKDKPIISIVEDQFISSLNKSGFTILERDETAIKQLIREGKDKYSLTFNKIGDNLIHDSINGDALEPGINFIETHLTAADITIFYRILEIGILYQDYPEDKEYNKRIGLVSIHIRVQNATNGEILYADNLTSESSDLVKKKFIKYLSSFHYSFFPYGYPIQVKEK